MKKRKVVGFTKAQRKWFLERDGHQCRMMWMEDGRWIRCSNTIHLHVHHARPRGWCSRHYPPTYGVNCQNNGIVICSFHHVGFGMPAYLWDTLAIHPDNEPARLAYRAGDKMAYTKMIERRTELNKKAIPYWNTRFDLMLIRWIELANEKFTKPYPLHSKYGDRGR